MAPDVKLPILVSLADVFQVELEFDPIARSVTGKKKVSVVYKALGAELVFDVQVGLVWLSRTRIALILTGVPGVELVVMRKLNASSKLEAWVLKEGATPRDYAVAPTWDAVVSILEGKGMLAKYSHNGNMGQGTWV